MTVRHVGIVIPLPVEGEGRAARSVRAADFKVIEVGRRIMNRRRMLGLVVALALTGVVGLGAAAERTKAVKAMADCCCDSCCCGDACREACCCSPACCGDGCCCDSTASKAAAVQAEACCEEDMKAVASCCPLNMAKVKVNVAR
jgi:hypothetical protein